MAKNIARLSDPYDIPQHLIPPGIIFQWVAKKSFGRIDPQYQAMIEAGWGEVPYKRLEDHFRGRYRGEGTEILVGGQVLMERAKEMSVVARDKEIDKAFLQANQGRNAAVQITQHIAMSAEEVATANRLKMSTPEYAAMKLTMVSNGLDGSLVYGRDGSLRFMERPKIRVAKYRWLNWLFDIISKETTEYPNER